MSGKSMVAFLFGAAVGAVGAYFYTKQKYESIIDEEIESVKNAYADEKDIEECADSQTEPEESLDESESARISYNKIASDYGHQTTEKRGPRHIEPEEFGESDLSITYTYYADGIVTDEMDIIVDDVDEAIGTDFVSDFDDDDCEVTYVRNDIRHCDYEIVRERERYVDTHPVIMEDS